MNRVGGESAARVSSDDLAEVFFDPVGFNGDWTLSEVERVTKALPELQLPLFDGTSVIPAIEAHVPSNNHLLEPHVGHGVCLGRRRRRPEERCV